MKLKIAERSAMRFDDKFKTFNKRFPVKLEKYLGTDY